jgi:hypothetical protein
MADSNISSLAGIRAKIQPQNQRKCKDGSIHQLTGRVQEPFLARRLLIGRMIVCPTSPETLTDELFRTLISNLQNLIWDSL